MGIILFNFQNNPLTQVLILKPVYRSGIYLLGQVRAQTAQLTSA